MTRRVFTPIPGRVVVKLAPIQVGTGITGMNGEEIVKVRETLDEEEEKQNLATIVKLGPPRTDVHTWLHDRLIEGESQVMISRLSGSRMELDDGNEMHIFWLLPYDSIQGIWEYEAEEAGDADPVE